MRRQSITAIVVALGTLSLYGGLTHAQKGGGDAAFVKKAAQGGIAEVDEGQLASEQAASTKVQDFGQQMVKDHSDINQALLELADSVHIPMPSETDAEHKAALAKLKNLKGAAFDAAYLKAANADHQAAIKLFETEAKQGSNAALKKFAVKTLPMIRQHYQMLQGLSKKPAPHKKG